MAGCRLIVCRLAIMAGAEICATFGIFVLRVILVASRAKRNFFDFVAFLSENYELLFRTGRCFLRFVEASILLAHILNLTGR